MAFTFFPEAPFFCSFFLAASVASKKLPISLERAESDLPAVTAPFTDAKIVKGSIFTSHQTLLVVLPKTLKSFLKS